MIPLPTASVLTVAPDNAPHRVFLTPLPTPGDFLLVLDNSALEKWKRCAMAARNYLVLGREAHARNAALTFGGAVHVGLEALARGIDTPELVQRVLSYFTENPTPLDEYRTPATAIELLEHYRQRALLPDYIIEIQEDADGPLIERAFELPLGVVEVGQRIMGLHCPPELKVDFSVVDETEGGVWISHIHIAWSGRIDTIARCGPDNPVRVLDHKTSSIDGDQFIQSFQLSSQVLGYIWAASQLWPQFNITSFCLNVLRLKRPGKGQGLMDRGPRGGEAPLAFFRAYFDYSPERLIQWKSDTLHHISDLIHCLVRDAWPLNDRHCFDKFGECPYRAACVIDNPVVRDRFLLSDAFKPVTWNPTHERT